MRFFLETSSRCSAKNTKSQSWFVWQWIQSRQHPALSTQIEKTQLQTPQQLPPQLHLPLCRSLGLWIGPTLNPLHPRVTLAQYSGSGARAHALSRRLPQEGADREQGLPRRSYARKSSSLL